MMRLICDTKSIFYRTGIRTDTELITSSLFRDCFGGLKSLMFIGEDNKTYVVADNLDKADWDYRAKNIDEMKYCYTYLTYNGPKGQRPTDEYVDFIEAMKSFVAENQKIIIPGDLGIDVYNDIAANFLIEDDFENVQDKKFYVYSRSCEEIGSQIHEKDLEINAKALQLIKDDKSRQILKPYVEDKRDTRFSALNELMANNGMDGCIFSSPLNVQEVTGMSYNEAREKEVYAFYRKNDEKVYIVSGKPLSKYKLLYISDSFNDGFRELDFEEKIGIEEGYLMVSRFKQLEIDKFEFISDSLRFWRENRSNEDLAYYIIVAKATGYAIDGAVEYALEKHAKHEKFTEMEVFEEYNRLKNVYLDENNIEAYLQNYDACTYSSCRSAYPGIASEYMIPLDGYTMRIDNGELIMDKYGYIHATSDICRTVCFNRPAKIGYEILIDIMRNEVIPNIKPGMKFSEIWEMGVKPIFEKQDKLKELGMIPPEVPFENIYHRNIGHGMSKQTRTANFITKDNHNILNNGSVGNIELPINYRNNIICVEDMWFVTEEGTINITVR